MSLGSNPRRLFELAREGVDIAQFGGERNPTIVVNHPKYVRHVLLERRDNYEKRTPLTDRVLRHFVAGSLLVAEGAEWQAQRTAAVRLLSAPSTERFHRVIDEQVRLLVNRVAGSAEPVGLLHEMSRLTLCIAGQAFFHTDLSAHDENVILGLDRIIATMRPNRPDFVAGADAIHRVARTILDQERESESDDPVAAWIRERGGSDGAHTPSLVSEMALLLLTSYETSSLALLWTLYLLSHHEEALSRVQVEVDAEGNGHSRSSGGARGSYLRRVISESMRLYPPAWSIARSVVADDEIAGMHIPAGSTVAIYPLALHHHTGLWNDPEQFDPDRFLPERSADRDQYAYVPFGAGHRACVGQRAAMIELPLMLSGLLRRAVPVMDPGQTVRLQGRINLRPSVDLQFRLEPR